MMRGLSPNNLSGDVLARWYKSRKEILRAVLRDPGASSAVKADAREKLRQASLQGQQFVAYPEEGRVLNNVEI